ncbi:MAG: hypothetical protein WCC84_16990 [Candidatus Cybelea sp.]
MIEPMTFGVAAVISARRYAARMLAAGVDVARVARILGYATPTTNGKGGNFSHKLYGWQHFGTSGLLSPYGGLRW